VVVGTLQYLVPATHNAIGASFLHRVYRKIPNAPLDSFDDIQHVCHSVLALEALAQAVSWWEEALTSGIREQFWPRDVCTLGVAWGDGSGSGSGGTFEWVESGNRALPKMEACTGSWNGTVHSFNSNWRDLRTVVETLKRLVSSFLESEVTYNICKKGSSKTLSLHLVVQQLRDL
jgi:hypothetical protein